jgi:glycogen debranching enzyme
MLTPGSLQFTGRGIYPKTDRHTVPPVARRGKAVEINALWYNALRLLAGWLRSERGEGDPDAARLAGHAERARVSFNERFAAGC